jgi:hypothetical protein
VSKARQRCPLESGQKLDTNALRRTGHMPRELNGAKAGTLRVSFPTIGFEQEIHFTSRPRHFGGRQFFFQCPATGRRCCVLWRPPGASRFACRQAWGDRVGYAVQFADSSDRAHLAKAKIRRQLGDVDELDNFPPKPKWIRWPTYERWRERYELEEKWLDDALMQMWRMRWVHLRVFSSSTDLDLNEPTDVDDLLDLVNSRKA